MTPIEGFLLVLGLFYLFIVACSGWNWDGVYRAKEQKEKRRRGEPWWEDGQMDKFFRQFEVDGIAKAIKKEEMKNRKESKIQKSEKAKNRDTEGE